MRISTKSTNFNARPDLVEQVETKTQETLRKYLGETDESVKCDIELGESDTHQHSGEVFRAEINLSANHKLYRAEAKNSTVDVAFDRALKELAKQVRRDKRKSNSFIRRGGARLKELARFGRREE